jgi:ubiquinone/menaquinone biosynthesis C-methylase UbiE
VADVTRLPFADRQFDIVVSTGAIALFPASAQRAALTEMARIAGVEVRLLESYEKRPEWYWGRFWATLFDGTRPIPRAVLHDSGLDRSRQWNVLWGAFSYPRSRV